MGYLYPMEEHIAELFFKKINEIVKVHKNETSNKIEEIEVIEEEQEQFEEISRGLIKGYSKKEIEEIENKSLLIKINPIKVVKREE